MASIGRTRAVALVTWLTIAKRVFGVTFARMASTASDGSRIGKGIAARTTVAPSRSAARRRALSVALYSWSVVSSSSPGRNRSDASTALTPVVAFGTNARPSASAPRKLATSRRASSSRPSRSRARNRTGSLSRRSRHARWASRTGPGQAPKEPWLRNEIAGSRRHGARSMGVGRGDRSVSRSGTPEPYAMAVCPTGGPPAASAGLVGALAGYDAGSRTDAR